MPMTHERSPDTDAVVDVLRGCNSEITYADLARQAGLSMARAKTVLSSARRIVYNERNKLFGVERGVGLVLLDSDGTNKVAEQWKTHVGKGSRRRNRYLSQIDDFERLPKTLQHSITINRTVLSVFDKQAKVKYESPAPPRPKVAPLPIADSNKLTQKPRR